MSLASAEPNILAESAELLLVKDGERVFVVEIPGNFWNRRLASFAALVVMTSGLLVTAASWPTQNTLVITLGACAGFLVVGITAWFYLLHRRRLRKDRLRELDQYHHFGCFDLQSQAFFSPNGVRIPFEQCNVSRKYSCGLSFVQLMLTCGEQTIKLSRLRSTTFFDFASVIATLRATCDRH